jgi:tetratricopeptide (TPR) repeat protein
MERRRLQSELAALAKAPPEAREAFFGKLRAAVRRHPGEPYFPLLGAYAARLQSRDPMPWLARAIERGPHYGQVHLALADVMHRHRKLDQAYMHLRLAAAYDVNLVEEVIARALRWAGNFESLARGFPVGAEGSALLTKLCARVAVAQALDCWREAARRDPNDWRAELRLAEALVTTLESMPARDDAEHATGAEAEAEAEARRVVGGLTDAKQGWRASYLNARLRAHDGDSVGAVQTLLATCPTNDAAEACLGLALDVARRVHDAALLERVTDRYLPALCASSAACAKAHERAGAAFAALDTWSTAVEHYSAAARAEPTTARWLRVAESATRAGAPTVAKTALVRAELIRSGHPQVAEP